MNRKALVYGLCATVIIILDRITKQSAYALEYVHEVTRWLSFEKALNRGVSWGLFNGSDQTMFMMVTIATSVLTIGIVAYGYTRYKNGYAIWGETLLCAGSFSNVIDRFWYNGVVDLFTFIMDNIRGHCLTWLMFVL